MPHKYTPIPALSATDRERFWACVHKTEACWNWVGGLSGTGKKNQTGRPMFKIKGKAFVAARISWVIAKGEDPGNFHVSRRCPGENNILCVNPDHLYLATHKEATRGYFTRYKPKAEKSPSKLWCRELPSKSDYVIERFWQFVDVCGPNDCWLWTGTLANDGRPHIGLGGESWLATRISWLIHHDNDPGNLHVLHNCPEGDNPSCVNPAHLWLGTHVENMADAARKGRKNRKLSNEQIKQIRELHDLGMSYKEIAAQFAVSASLVCMIINRTTRCHI